jgi:hypothetical protein
VYFRLEIEKLILRIHSLLYLHFFKMEYNTECLYPRYATQFDSSTSLQCWNWEHRVSFRGSSHLEEVLVPAEVIGEFRVKGGGQQMSLPHSHYHWFLSLSRVNAHLEDDKQ